MADEAGLVAADDADDDTDIEPTTTPDDVGGFISLFVGFSVGLDVPELLDDDDDDESCFGSMGSSVLKCMLLNEKLWVRVALSLFDLDNLNC